MRAEALKEIDVSACQKSAGKIEGVGIFGTPSCVIYYPNGGSHVNQIANAKVCFSFQK